MKPVESEVLKVMLEVSETLTMRYEEISEIFNEDYVCKLHDRLARMQSEIYTILLVISDMKTLEEAIELSPEFEYNYLQSITKEKWYELYINRK